MYSSSSDGDDEIAALVIAYTRMRRLKKREAARKKKRSVRFWVNPYLRERKTKGRFATDFEDMKAYPPVFYENFHMDADTFEAIFSLVEPYLVPKRHTRHDLIPTKLKFAVVLEYLASGSIPRHMASIYRISKARMGFFIDLVCDALCIVLRDCFPKLSKADFVDIANGFMDVWNFPNCIGEIDGKHIDLKAPNNSGSMFFNYKGFYSIVLFAVADHCYKFIYMDVGAYGSDGDAGIFANSEFGNAVLNDLLDFPENAAIADAKVPYFFIGDDAFPLSRRILKPFPGKKLSDEEIIFNYRLSRARRCIENAFGILCSKWLCLKRTLFCKPDRAQKIVAACCLLHNYMLTNTSTYCPRNCGDWLNEDGTITEGEWRATISSISDSTMFNSDLEANRGRQNESGKRIRDFIKNYVNSQGAVEWQRKAVGLE